MTPDNQERLPQTAQTKILLVEDNPIDARLTRHAFSQLRDWPSSINVVDDGEKAIRFLRREPSFENVEKPDLVILDLNLPKYDGAEVLQVIRATQDLQNLLVFIFSSSPVDVAQERMREAKVTADYYFEKPCQVGAYLAIANQINATYLQVKDGKKAAKA